MGDEEKSLREEGNPFQNSTVAVSRPFATDFLSTFGSSVVGYLCVVVASVLIARAVGPEGKGILSLIDLASGQAVMFLSLGIEYGIIYYVGGKHIDKQTASATSFFLSLGLGALAAGFTVGVLRMVLKEVSSVIWLLIYISALLAPILLYSMYLGCMVRMGGRIVELAGLNLMSKFLYTLVIIGCFLAARNVPTILIATITTNVVSTAVSWLFYAKWGYLPSKISFASRKAARQLISYGIKGHIGTIFQSLNYRFDMYLVAYFLSPAQVGIYSVAVGFSEMLWMIPNNLGVVITQRAATRPWEEVNQITATVTRLTMALMALGCIAWAFIGRILIPLLYGKAFSGAVGAMFWLLPGIWFLGLWKNLHSDIACRGYPLYKTYSSGAAVVTTVILDLLLIPKMGIIGAALASSVAYAIGAIVVLIPFCKITGVRVADLFFLRMADVLYAKASFFQTFGSLREEAKT